MQWVLSSKEINFPYPLGLTLLHMVFSSVLCFMLTKVLKIMKVEEGMTADINNSESSSFLSCSNIGDIDDHCVDNTWNLSPLFVCNAIAKIVNIKTQECSIILDCYA
nr:putative sugar phosphate/phosphate translocator [Quercus suber]